MDSSRAFLKVRSLNAQASRAVLNNQAVFTPSAWHVREVLSLDLAVLWPERSAYVTERFRRSGRERRDRFLERTGVRYRVLPARQVVERAPVTRIPCFNESFLFDWGAGVMPRVAMAEEARVVPREEDQIEALFQPGWDSRATALVQRQPGAAGTRRRPVAPSARIIAERSNRVAIDAGAGAQGGYLVLLDSYSPDWRVSVDGHPAEMVQANGLFRAVRLVPGRHLVEFSYRPAALAWGLVVSALALAVTVGLLAWPVRQRRQGVA
jgi:hypothetical protein